MYPDGNQFPYGPSPLGSSFFGSYTFESSCDGSNPIDLVTGVPASMSAPRYNVVDETGTAVGIGADWGVLEGKVSAATSGQ